MQKGRFIVFEGIDGSGLTTQAELVKKYLEKEGWVVYLTKEPTDGPSGAQIRLALAKRVNISPEALALLFAADRMDHLNEDIIPKIESGVTVLCDRYYLSSFAYQLVDMDIEWLRQINSKCIKPDLTILFEIPPLISQRRMKQQRWHVELYEEIEKLKEVQWNYKTMAETLQHERENIEVIDGNRPINTVKKDVINSVEKIMEKA